LGYVAGAEYFKEDGWRAFSPSEAARALLSTTYRTDSRTYDLVLAAAESDLNGNGPAPVQLLAQDRSAIFTHPDHTRNRALLATLRAEHLVSALVRLTGVTYVRRNRTITQNA